MAKGNTEFSWDRQKGESERCYEQFLIYKEMKSRSMKMVAERLHLHPTAVRRNGAKWNWVARARDYDNYIEHEKCKAEIARIRKMNAQQAAIGVLMQERALKGIKNIDVSKLSVKDLINLMIQGTSLERKARLSEIDTYQAKQEREHGIETKYNDDGLEAALKNSVKKVWE